MNLELNIYQILVYYDEPHVFIAEDCTRGKFIGLYVEEIENKSHYILTKISSKRLVNFVNGTIDLRDIFTTPEIEEFYEAWDIYERSFNVTIYNENYLTEYFLPEEGFFYSESNTLSGELIVEETLQMENTVVHISIEDDPDKHSIPIEILGEYIKLYQDLIKNTYKKAISKCDSKEYTFLNQTYNYNLRAFASSPGSFNLHLAANAQKDIFGSTKIELALDLLNPIFNDFSSEDNYIKHLKIINGRAIGSYRKLIELIDKENININYKWFSPGKQEVYKRKFGRLFAQKVIKVLNSTDELETVRVTFRGTVRQIDFDKGTWRIRNDEDNKEYSGTVGIKNMLDGIVVNNKIYQFICDETTVEEKVSGKEKISYSLIKIK